MAELEGDSDRTATRSSPSSTRPATVLSHSTYLGGNGDDDGHTIAVDSTGAYVTGFTDSRDFDTARAVSRATAASTTAS